MHLANVFFVISIQSFVFTDALSLNLIKESYHLDNLLNCGLNATSECEDQSILWRSFNKPAGSEYNQVGLEYHFIS